MRLVFYDGDIRSIFEEIDYIVSDIEKINTTMENDYFSIVDGKVNDCDLKELYREYKECVRDININLNEK